ncbi:hypothetical protein DFH09DRAFT_1090098 [Mycena vulgaris]|nr:hypothetical protein DFH09DRAFT_1090098 [Mycena vulgaris]
MPLTRSARLRGSAAPFTVLGRKSMFSRARGFTINGGTFNISGSQPLEHPSLPNRLSHYVEHLEARLAELEDLINLSTENNPNDQPAYGDETGAPELVRESCKDVMDHSGSMPANSSQGGVETAVRDACPIYRSGCVERLQAEDTAVLLDGSDISIGTIQL